MECLRHEPADRDWTLMAGEIDSFTSTQNNQERTYFFQLVNTMEKELNEIEQNMKVRGTQVDLIEVFCSDQSSLTEQVLQQGGKAMRFGLSQGNLQKAEGRKILFTAVCRHRPKHVWMSPTCKPWSSLSNLNCQKSIEVWD